MDRYVIRVDSYDTYLLLLKNRGLSFTNRVMSFFSELEIVRLFSFKRVLSNPKEKLSLYCFLARGVNLIEKEKGNRIVSLNSSRFFSVLIGIGSSISYSNFSTLFGKKRLLFIGFPRFR